MMATYTVQCYIEDNGKTLMLQRNKKKNDIHEGKWVGIGGHIEKSETSDEAIIREVFEETGLIPKNLQLHGVITFPNFKEDDEDEVMYLYSAKGYIGEIIECNEGYLEWIDNERLETLNMWEGDRIYFKWMQEKGFFVAKIEYNLDETIKDYSINWYNRQ